VWARVWVPPPPLTPWQRWGRPLTLLLVTACSVFLAEALDIEDIPGHGPVVFLRLRDGFLLAGCLLSILLAHEMGHYLTCRYYGVDATLPHFVPSPWFPVLGWFFWQPISMVGTFGAFIRIRSPIPHRRALFDIGVAGPLAGFLVCLPVLWFGIQDARIVPPSPEGIPLGGPFLFQAVEQIVHGSVPDGMTLRLGPRALAAWFGLLVTALNLMPIGQLDGGHLTYALLREKALPISRIGSWVCVALVFFGPSWILWAVLVRLLGRRHPSTLDDEAPVGRGRVVVGFFALIVFVLCFVPNPIAVSWPEVLRAVGLDKLLP